MKPSLGKFATLRIALLILLFFLGSCGGFHSDLVIESVSVASTPPPPSVEPRTVSFSITYKNISQESSYSNIQLVVNYAEGLSGPQADPAPTKVDEQNRTATWELPGLDPGASRTLVIQFDMANKIPPGTYELNVTANISGSNAQGTPASSSATGFTYVPENPTPIPSPTPTPVVVVLQDGRVTITLPWQPECPSCYIEEQDFNAYQYSFEQGLKNLPVHDENINIKPYQPVIYFVVRDSNKNEIKTFSPPMTISVKYDENLVKEAGGEENLVLLILHHTSEDKSAWYWYVAPNFSLQGDMTAVITVSSWNSHICWGVR